MFINSWWKITFCFQKEWQSVPLKWLQVGYIYWSMFFVEISRKNDVGSVTSWEVVERPLCGSFSVRILISKPASNKKNGILYKKPQITIFTGPTGCGKTHLLLDLIEKEYNKHCDYITIICPTLRWNKIYHSKDWIKNDDNVWVKGKLYQWIEKLSELLVRSETLFIIDYIIADEGPDKKKSGPIRIGHLK